MRSFYARSVMIAAGALCLANGTRAQAQYNAPSILPNAPARQLNSWAQPAGYRDTNPTYGQNYGGYSPQYYSVATPPETPPSVPATPKLAAPETIPGPNQPGQPRLQQPLQKFLPHGQPQTQQPYTQPYSQQPYSQQYQQQPGQPSAQTPYDAAAQSPWSSGNYGNYGNNSNGGGAGGYADGGYGADAYGSSSGYGSGSSGGYGRGFGGLGGGFGGVGSGAAGYGGYGGGYAGYGGGSSCGNWFGGIGGLVMTRSHSNYMWLSNNSDEPYEKVLTNRDADMSWASGQQVMFGRYLNCGQNAIQFVYWGLNPAQAQGTAYESQLGGGDLFTLLNFDSLYYDNGIIPNQNVVNGFDGAYRHQLITRNNFQNFELNLFCFSLGGGSCGGFGGCGAGGYGSAAGGSGMGGYGCNSCGSGGCDSCSTCGSGGCGGNGSRLRMSWLGGFRYFRFTDYFLYSADTDGTFGNSPAEIEYRIRTVNNLFGFQLGSRLDYGLTRRWSVYAGPKMGIYANQMYSQQHVGNDNVCAFINNPSSPGYNGEMYDVAVRRSAVAFLGELDLGSTYRFTNCWSVSTGYRVVAASGVALTTNQIPQAFGDLSTVEKINNNGALLLHGAYFNVNYNW